MNDDSEYQIIVSLLGVPEDVRDALMDAVADLAMDYPGTDGNVAVIGTPDDHAGCRVEVRAETLREAEAELRSWPKDATSMAYNEAISDAIDAVHALSVSPVAGEDKP